MNNNETLEQVESGVINLTPELVEQIDQEYKEMGGQVGEGKDDINRTGLKDETFEAMVTDPSLVLGDFSTLGEKHGLHFLDDLLNPMGFTLPTLKGLIFNKPITEQIYVLNRELRVLLSLIGVKSGGSENGYGTQEMRALLAETTTSREWLELLDKQVFPYIKFFKDNGVVDKEWFVREENKVHDETTEMVDTLREVSEVNMEYLKEAEDMSAAIAGAFDENGNLIEDPDDSEEEPEGDVEDAEIIEVDHGGKTVVEVPAEAVETETNQ